MCHFLTRLLFGLLTIAAVCVFAASADAATITVNTTDDDTNTNGNCTLREAVMAANANADVDGCVGVNAYGTDTIVLPLGTYTFAISSHLAVSATVTIQGAGAATSIIDGNYLAGIFDITDGTVTINDVTIRNGANTGGGAGIAMCPGTLYLNRSIVEGNQTGGRGGGIALCNVGYLFMDNSIVRNNSAGDFGGGIAQHVSPSTVTISNSTISDNVSGTGGGGIESFSTLTITNTTISGNIASGLGGGLIHTAGILTMANSTISGNSTNGGAGGVYLAGDVFGTVQNMNNVTIADNTADADNNAATNWPGVPGEGGGLMQLNGVYGNVVNLKNTIIAGNFGPTSTADDCYGTLNSQDYNLIGDITGCTINGTTTHNITGMAPLLGPLADNGGPTDTHALLAGSPAIDAGNPGVPGGGGSTCEAADQRGVTRPQDAACDIGSVESTPPADGTPPVVTPTVTGTLGNNGWYTSNVLVTWAVTDGESAISSTTGCGDSSVTSDTVETTVTCSATSGGGTSTQSVTIKRDATPPTATASAGPPANANGWRKTNVTVSFSGTDALSGGVTCDPNIVLSAEGANQSASGHCYDAAGNRSALATVSGINIDKTNPTVTVTTPSNGAVYSRNQLVVTNYLCSDLLSGIASGGCAGPVASGQPLDTSKKVNNGRFTVSATDKAGNQSKMTITYSVK